LGKTTVSILIAAYNAGPFLHRAVQSALAQTWRPFEILIVDDASTDNTLFVANALAAADPCIRVLTLPVNSGPAAARNAGLNAARGEWVAVLDADDAYVPTRLETLASVLSENNLDIALDNFLFFDAGRGVGTSAALPPSDTIEPVDIYKFVDHAHPYGEHADWGLLKPIFRREFLAAHRLRYPESSRHGEDFLLMFLALHAGARCVLVYCPGYLYTTRDSGMSRTPIDYKSMIEHMSDLCDARAVRSDIRLSRLLQQCIVHNKKWLAECQLRTAKEKREYLRAALLTIMNMSLAGRVTKSVYRAIRRVMLRT
jgi:succinoglycan biosynthesis protein ExoO